MRLSTIRSFNDGVAIAEGNYELSGMDLFLGLTTRGHRLFHFPPRQTKRPVDDRGSPRKTIIAVLVFLASSSSTGCIRTAAQGTADHLAPGEPIGDEFITVP